MPVEGVDLQIHNLIAESQAKLQEKLGEADEAEIARKKAAQKLEQKKIEQKAARNNVYDRREDINQRVAQLLDGRGAGPDVARSMQQWGNSQDLQQRLTDAQRQHFIESAVKDPKAAAKTADAMGRLSSSGAMGRGVPNSRVGGLVQDALFQNPGLERTLTNVSKNRFMQSPRHGRVKGDFVKFAVKHGTKGNNGVVDRAGNLLANLGDRRVGSQAMHDSLAAMDRDPNNPRVADDIDRFSSRPEIHNLPRRAATQAVGLVARADGDAAVSDGLSRLAGEPKFQKQSPNNQAGFFETVGAAAPQQFVPTTQALHQSLMRPDFPTRSNQVGALLQRAAASVKTSGAKALDPAKLNARARAPVLPPTPDLASEQGLDEDQAALVRAENRIKVIQYYNEVNKLYDKAGQQLDNAQYFEDVNALRHLQAVPPLDVNTLSGENAKLVAAKSAELQNDFAQIQKLMKRRSRELRSKRMPWEKRRARLAKKRLRAKQPRWFQPQRAAPIQAFAQVGGAAVAAMPAPSSSSMPDIASHVAQAVAAAGGQPLTQRQALTLAKAIAGEVARELTTQVTHQLMEHSVSNSAPPPAPATEVAATQGSTHPTPATKPQMGRVDGWGIQRTFEADLGAKQAQSGPPPAATGDYRGPRVVKAGDTMRRFDELSNVAWKDLSRSESAILRNLGWDQPHWDNRFGPTASWPVAMATPFGALRPIQRESVAQLGFSAPDWDRRVAAMSGSGLS